MSEAAPAPGAAVRHPPGRHYEVNGRQMWVEAEGDGPALVLLAGFGPAGSHLIFHPHFTDMAGDHRVLYVDLVGRGRSERPRELTEITFASDLADVAALIEQLGLGAVHVFGFSYGGLLGQALALDHPGLLRTLTLANTLHGPQMWQLNHVNINREIANQHPDLWDRIMHFRRQGVPSTDPRLAGLFGQAARLVRFRDPSNAAKLLDEPGARNPELYPVFAGENVDFVIGGQVAAIPDFRPRLAEIQAPVMVLAGRFDRALYPRLQREFVEFDPRIELHVLEDSGSFCHVEEPGTVFALVRDFIRKHDAA